MYIIAISLHILPRFDDMVTMVVGRDAELVPNRTILQVRTRGMASAVDRFQKYKLLLLLFENKGVVACFIHSVFFVYSGGKVRS